MDSMEVDMGHESDLEHESESGRRTGKKWSICLGAVRPCMCAYMYVCVYMWVCFCVEVTLRQRPNCFSIHNLQFKLNLCGDQQC